VIAAMVDIYRFAPRAIRTRQSTRSSRSAFTGGADPGGYSLPGHSLMAK
jgi:hypothetical protein